MNKDVMANPTIGTIISVFCINFISLKYKKESVRGLISFDLQNTRDHIRAIIKRVINVPKRIAATNHAPPFVCRLSVIKAILGQKPDSGGIPTKEKNVIAIAKESNGYLAYIPPKSRIL